MGETQTKNAGGTAHGISDLRGDRSHGRGETRGALEQLSRFPNRPAVFIIKIPQEKNTVRRKGKRFAAVS